LNKVIRVLLEEKVLRFFDQQGNTVTAARREAGNKSYYDIFYIGGQVEAKSRDPREQ
jgi:hypothetical protein